MVDTSAFRKVLSRLQTMMEAEAATAKSGDENETLIHRTALIKGFEYSYEMATKTMKRFVESLNLQRETKAEMSFRELLRAAFDFELIRDIDSWFLYRDKRNSTSHAYADEIAEDVVKGLPSFLEDARFLLNAVEKLPPQPVTIEEANRNVALIHAPEEWVALVKKILHFHLPEGYRVVLFGSRATGVRIKRHSDFDLCVMGEPKLDGMTLTNLRDGFADSNLPVRVDVVDWHEAPAFLKKIIEKDGVELRY